MKNVRSIVLVVMSLLALSSNAFAAGVLFPEVECQQTKSIFPDCNHGDKPNGDSHAVPEIDAAGGVVAIGLLIGLMGMIRERRRGK